MQIFIFFTSTPSSHFCHTIILITSSKVVSLSCRPLSKSLKIYQTIATLLKLTRDIFCMTLFCRYVFVFDICFFLAVVVQPTNHPDVLDVAAPFSRPRSCRLTASASTRMNVSQSDIFPMFYSLCHARSIYFEDNA